MKSIAVLVQDGAEPFGLGSICEVWAEPYHPEDDNPVFDFTVCTPDPGRVKGRAGFDLHPQMVLWGPVSRAVLPAVPHVREGTAGDRDLCDSLDRRTRGAAHGADHALLAEQLRLIVIDHPAGQGQVLSSHGR